MSQTEQTSTVILNTVTNWIENPKFVQHVEDNLAMVLYNTKKRFGTLTDETFTLENRYTATIVGHTITLNYFDGTVKTYTDPTPNKPLPDSDDFSQFI